MAYVRRKEAESRLMAIEIVSAAGLALGGDKKPGNNTGPPANRSGKISGAEMLGLMGVDL